MAQLSIPYGARAYPAGRRPGFDPRHVANSANGVGLSAVGGFQGGGMIDVLHGAVPQIGTGQTTSIVAGIGPALNIPHGQYAYCMFPGYNHTPTAVLYAAILMVNSSVGTANRIINTNGQNNDSNCTDMGFNSSLNLGIGYGTTGRFSNLILPQLTPIFIACCSTAFGGGTVVNSVMVNLNTGAVTPDHVAGANATFGTTVSAFFNIGADSSFASASSCKIAAAMYASNTMLSDAQLMQWAQAPWDFWYPPTANNIISQGLSVASTQKFLPVFNMPFLGW